MNYTESWARFSDDGKHRLELLRGWSISYKCNTVAFIGLNPSTANENYDDPTIKRVVSISHFNGFNQVVMLNLFTQVTPYPEELISNAFDDDPLLEWMKSINTFVCAWGNFKVAQARGEQVKTMLGDKAFAIHINKNGSPRHPLYCKTESKFIKY